MCSYPRVAELGGARGTRGALASPILDLRMQTLRADNRLLRSLSRQPLNHISVQLPLFIPTLNLLQTCINGVFTSIYMWLSGVEIKNYSIAYLDCVTMFKVL